MGNSITELDKHENWYGDVRVWHVYVCGESSGGVWLVQGV